MDLSELNAIEDAYNDMLGELFKTYAAALRGAAGDAAKVQTAEKDFVDHLTFVRTAKARAKVIA